MNAALGVIASRSGSRPMTTLKLPLVPMTQPRCVEAPADPDQLLRAAAEPAIGRVLNRGQAPIIAPLFDHSEAAAVNRRSRRNVLS